MASFERIEGGKGYSTSADSFFAQCFHKLHFTNSSIPLFEISRSHHSLIKALSRVLILSLLIVIQQIRFFLNEVGNVITMSWIQNLNAFSEQEVTFEGITSS